MIRIKSAGENCGAAFSRSDTKDVGQACQGDAPYGDGKHPGKNKQSVAWRHPRSKIFTSAARKMKISKRAQFYLLTAFVLMGFSALLLQSGDVTPTSSTVFKRLYENFVFESSQSINNALLEQADINEEYSHFLDSMVSYARMKKMSLEVFSILASGDYVYFTNKMQNPVRIITINETVLPGSETYFLRSNLSEIALEVKDDVFHENIYKFTVSDKGTEAKAVLRIKKGADREIFVKD
jgi:hypothetical protein